MRLPARLTWSFAVLALLLITGCDKPTANSDAQRPGADQSDQDAIYGAEENGKRIPFDDAEVFFELNTTANDLGLQLFLDADGWRKVRVDGPGNSNLVQILAQGSLGTLGITELRFESAEPEPAEVLARFPAGEYVFRGRTVEGENLYSSASLSHQFLPAFSFTPANGLVVDPNNAVVQWNISGAEQVEVIIEQDELGHVLDVILSGDITSLTIPSQFLTPGTEFKIEILGIAENGNRTIVESTFRTQ